MSRVAAAAATILGYAIDVLWRTWGCATSDGMCVNATCALERAGSRRVLEVMSWSTAVVSGGVGRGAGAPSGRESRVVMARW